MLLAVLMLTSAHTPINKPSPISGGNTASHRLRQSYAGFDTLMALAPVVSAIAAIFLEATAKLAALTSLIELSKGE
jgi:hypothetical protein